MDFFLHNFKTRFPKNTTEQMFQQVTLQRFFVGVNHLKKYRRYFEKKSAKSRKNHERN